MTGIDTGSGNTRIINNHSYLNMGFFDQVKAAQSMMAGKSPAEIKEMMEQAKAAQAAMEEMVRKIVAEEFKKRGL